MSKGLHQGEEEFVFPNGDIYKGGYCAHVSGIAWREGQGVYTTHDGQTYEGTWKDDKLNEGANIQIRFQNQDQYSGRIRKYKYHGPGTYTFANDTSLTANFANNKPSGEIILIDHRNHLWFGVAAEEDVILYREHVFSSELDSERGRGRPISRIGEGIEEESVKSEEYREESVDMKEMEKRVFAKSTRTPSEIDFEDSDWVKDHKKFEEMQKIVLNKLKQSGFSSLTDEEKIWYKEFLKSAKLWQDYKTKKPKKIQDLLKQYFDEEAKHTCPPPTVFYPDTGEK